MNPWPGKDVLISDDTARRDVPHNVTTTSGECVSFPVRPDHVYRVQCSTE